MQNSFYYVYNNVLSAKIERMKRVLIVGASSGIGYETAKKFLQKGYHVINISRRECDLDGVENLLCNVAEREKLDEVLTKILEYKSLDCFIYSAGFSMAAPLEYVLEGDYRYLYEVNLFAFIHCARTLIPVLRVAQGTICAISSMASITSIPYDLYYCGSKSALNATISALRYELNPEGINVIAVLPGGTKTKFTEKRKIYPPPAVNGYAKALTIATEQLEKIEQNGQKAEKVANYVYKKCTLTSPMASLYPSGIFNKLVALFLRICPQSISYLITKTLFETIEELEEV